MVIETCTRCHKRLKAEPVLAGKNKMYCSWSCVPKSKLEETANKLQQKSLRKELRRKKTLLRERGRAPFEYLCPICFEVVASKSAYLRKKQIHPNCQMKLKEELFTVTDL